MSVQLVVVTSRAERKETQETLFKGGPEHQPTQYHIKSGDGTAARKWTMPSGGLLDEASRKFLRTGRQ